MMYANLSQIRLGKKSFSAVFVSLILMAYLISLASIPPASAQAVGPPHLGIYADGILFRTVATPTDLPTPDGAPFDILYVFPDDPSLYPVSESKPGDRDYNGGRWHVYEVMFNDGAVQYESAEEILQAEEDGDVTITSTETYFVCPLIKYKE